MNELNMFLRKFNKKKDSLNINRAVGIINTDNNSVRIYIDRSVYGPTKISNTKYVASWWHPWMHLENSTHRQHITIEEAEHDLFRALSYHNFLCS